MAKNFPKLKNDIKTLSQDVSQTIGIIKQNQNRKTTKNPRNYLESSRAHQKMRSKSTEDYEG